MKIAIIHDDLMRRGGAEQVALALHRTFPTAPIYTLCYKPNLTYPEFKNATIITSLFQNIVKTESAMKMFFFPIGFWCMRLLKVQGFDKVILSSTYASKYANIEKGTQVINYCHNPFRLAWFPDSYESYTTSTGLKRQLFKFIVRRLQRIDYKYSRKCEITVVNSEIVRDRVRNVYQIEPEAIVNPPVQFNKIRTSKAENYLVVSRLESYKKVDLVIKAFNKCGRQLIIIGNGSQKEDLKDLASGNIQFKQGLSTEDLKKEYAKARALIFPQLEDFGITPLEANSCGTPVIAYGYGGVTETMIPYPQEKASALFFEKQEVSSVVQAIKKFEQIEYTFKMDSLHENVARFSLDIFSKKIKAVLL